MDQYIKLAKDVIKEYLTSGEILKPAKNLPREMFEKQAGVFVSLHKKGQLRGCIGTISPTTKNIAAEIIQNAISAAVDDPRFDSVEAREIDDLEIAVDVLNPAEEIKDQSELDIRKYGIICQTGYKKGVLLPDIEGVASVEEQIEIACQKAGINTQSEKFKILKFTVTRHEAK
jgi:AmmeMemoRadiSam system protein A